MDRIKPDIIFLQETMVSGVKACSFFLDIKKGWEVASIDAFGLSGGLPVAWDPAKADLKAFIVSAGIILSGRLCGFSEEINLLNIYGPYHSK